MITYIIWNPEQTIFNIGNLAIRWYGLCILLAFLGGRQIVRYIYMGDHMPLKDADNFSTWVLVAALLGARLGEVFFYDFSYYRSHPIEMLLPVTFEPHFKFIGYSGLSYHGAIIGSLIGTYLYANYPMKVTGLPFRWKIKREKRKEKRFLWLSTPLALAMMMGFLVRIGNFVNSEIIGTPTHSSYGVLFVKDVTERIKSSSRAILQVKTCKNKARLVHQAYQPVTFKITFKNWGLEENMVRDILETVTKRYLVEDKWISHHVHEAPQKPLNYTLTKTRKKAYVAEIETLGIPRHPVQLYESIAYLITLVVHLYWWKRQHKVLKDGIIAGSAMITCYSLRFIGEFFKEPFNVLFDGFVTLTTGHLLSLITVLGGIALIIYSHTVSKKKYSQSIPI